MSKYEARALIFGPNGTTFRPGDVIAEGFPEAALAAHLKHGTIVAFDARTDTPEAPPAPPPTDPRLNRPVTPWTLDPTLLAGKDLEDLTVMILERDDKAEQPATIEDAIAFLTKDFIKK